MSRQKKLTWTSPSATTLPSRPKVRISTPPDAAKERVSAVREKAEAEAALELKKGRGRKRFSLPRLPLSLLLEFQDAMSESDDEKVLALIPAPVRRLLLRHLKRTEQDEIVLEPWEDNDVVR